MKRFLPLLILSAFSGAQTVAVIDFEGNRVSQSESRALTDRLNTELFNICSFELVERNQIEEIINEQGFQQSGCTTVECAVDVGKLLGAEKIVIGSVSKVGSIYTISARLVNSQSGRIEKNVSFDHDGGLGFLLTDGMKNIAFQLCGKYPPIEKVKIVKPSKPTYQPPVPSYQKPKPKPVKLEKMVRLVRGPIGGFTKYPRKGKFLFKLVYVQTESNSFIDDEGESQNYGEYYYDGEANPTLFRSLIRTRIGYSLSEKMKLYVVIPYYLSQYEKMNPIPEWEEWFNENDPDRSGETGMGDIILGTKYLLTMNEFNRTAFGIEYYSSTGIAKDKISDSSLFPTGSGHTAVELILDSDFRLFGAYLISFGISYSINNEWTYTEDIGGESTTYKEKPGNEIFYRGQILGQTLGLIRGGEIGIDLFGGIIGKTVVDGEDVENSEYNLMKLSYILGYLFTFGEALISLRGRYPFYINGTGISIWYGFYIDLEILF